MLCCIFNYAPLYRQAIYKCLDGEFDAQFCFGKNLPGRPGIARQDYEVFHRKPKEFKVRTFGGYFPWYCGIWTKPLNKKYSTFLITGEFNWAYFPFLLLCRLTGKKVYAWGHGLKKWGKYGGLKRFFYNSLETYFIYGEAGRKRMIELGLAPEKLSVIYNSLGGKVDMEANAKAQSDIYLKHFGNSDPVIIFSGRLTGSKRLDLLLLALREIHSCNLVLVGDGPQMEKLKALAAPVEDRVWFYGECYDNERLAELNYNADLCVSPGNVGLSAVQAMNYGVPVISHSDFETQMPEYETIVEGKTGALFEKDNLDSLVKCISEWLAGHADREETRRNCYAVIDGRWNIEVQMQVFRNVLPAKCRYKV